jgi:hypothetical protein
MRMLPHHSFRSGLQPFTLLLHIHVGIPFFGEMRRQTPHSCMRHKKIASEGVKDKMD